MALKLSKLSVSIAVGSLTALILGVPAFAAGTGYTPGQSFGVSRSGGGTLDVVSAQSVTSSATMLSARTGSANLTLTVPSGAFPTGAQIVIARGNASGISGVPSGSKALEDIDISFLNSSDKSVTPAKPVTFSIKNSSISSNAIVYKSMPKGLTKVSATAKTGEVEIVFTTDPEFVIVQPAVANATKPVTGMPFAALLAGGGILVLIGALVAFYRRKTS